MGVVDGKGFLSETVHKRKSADEGRILQYKQNEKQQQQKSVMHQKISVQPKSDQ